MRALASYLTGLGLLASLMFVGGAWSSPEPTTHLATVEVHPNHVSSNLASVQGIIADPEVPDEIRVLPPGCSIPSTASTCAPTVVAGGLTFPSEVVVVPTPGAVGEARLAQSAPIVTTTTTPAPAPTAAVATAPAAPAPVAAAPAPNAAPAPAPIEPPVALAPKQVEGWRTLVASFFAPGDVDRALTVIGCESSGDPNAKNPTSSASGLFQHLGRFWPERSVKAGWAGADIFDPTANVAVAAWLVYEGGGWSHWNPSRHCWG